MKLVDDRNLKSIQFELWQECNNHCTFCYLKDENNRYTPDTTKIVSLLNVLKTLNDETIMKNYQCVAFIGGEFFQGQLKNPTVRELFFDVMKKTANLLKEKKITSVWIPATLTIGKQEDLYSTLRLFDDLTNVWIITSWDTIGRFKTPKMEKTWKDHVNNLHTTFPDLKINVTTILTQDLIDRYMRGEFVFNQLREDWDVSFFFKQCGNFFGDGELDTIDDNEKDKQKCNQVLPKFFPNRKSFISFLIKFKNQEPQFMWDRLFNIDYRADELIRNFNDGTSSVSHRHKGTKKEVDDAETLSCGHPVVYRAYCDSPDCVLCDKLKIGLFE